MKTTTAFRAKMRKNEHSNDKNKKIATLVPIKKNSKESKQFLRDNDDDDDIVIEYEANKKESAFDYFDDEADE